MTVLTTLRSHTSYIDRGRELSTSTTKLDYLSNASFLNSEPSNNFKVCLFASVEVFMPVVQSNLLTMMCFGHKTSLG
jgi:hypothetical protein